MTSNLILKEKSCPFVEIMYARNGFSYTFAKTCEVMERKHGCELRYIKWYIYLSINKLLHMLLDKKDEIIKWYTRQTYTKKWITRVIIHHTIIQYSYIKMIRTKIMLISIDTILYMTTCIFINMILWITNIRFYKLFFEKKNTETWFNQYQIQNNLF